MVHGVYVGGTWMAHVWYMVVHGQSVGGLWVVRGWSLGGTWVVRGWSMGGAWWHMGGPWVVRGWYLDGPWVVCRWYRTQGSRRPLFGAAHMVLRFHVAIYGTLLGPPIRTLTEWHCVVSGHVMAACRHCVDSCYED